LRGARGGHKRNEAGGAGKGGMRRAMRPLASEVRGALGAPKRGLRVTSPHPAQTGSATSALRVTSSKRPRLQRGQCLDNAIWKSAAQLSSRSSPRRPDVGRPWPAVSCMQALATCYSLEVAARKPINPLMGDDFPSRFVRAGHGCQRASRATRPGQRARCNMLCLLRGAKQNVRPIL